MFNSKGKTHSAPDWDDLFRQINQTATAVEKSAVHTKEVIDEWVKTQEAYDAYYQYFYSKVTEKIEAKKAGDPETELEDAADLLPGMNEVVQYPCKCGSSKAALQTVIMHLNDMDEWTREAIADWIEGLDIDLEFKCDGTTL